MDAEVQASRLQASAGRDPGVAPHARRWLTALVLWSLFVWATRIDNVVADNTLDTAGRALRLALSLSFVVLAIVAAAAWWRGRSTRTASVVATTLAAWTIVVWIIRGAGIALGDHEAEFIIVHLVLAAISIGLAVAVLRSRPGRAAFVVPRSSK